MILKQEAASWLEVVLKARSMLIDPATLEGRFVMDPDISAGSISPDGKRIAYVASDPQRVKDGHDFDLFVADFDPNQPSRKANIRCVTTDQVRPTDALWTHNSDGLAFLAQRSAEDAHEAVWFVDLKAGTPPQCISDDAIERAWQLSITPMGGIACVQLRERKNKEQFSDLIVQRPPNIPPRVSEGGRSRNAFLQNQHISSYAFSPDNSMLAWSGLGSMFIVNLESGESREIPLHGIHRQLINHSVYQFAWRPDGKIIAIQCGFLGGVSRGPNADPNAPWPRMFAEDKVFFVPVDWSPTAKDLTIGENFPSPMVDDPKAEVSPPAGDQSKPWWVREIPMRPLALKWISADDAKGRIAEHPAPPEQRED